MNIGFLIIALTSFLFVVWLGIVFFKILRKRELPNHYYTPFDNISGHTSVEFHEEKEEHEDEDNKGDDKDKFKYKLK